MQTWALERLEILMSVITFGSYLPAFSCFDLYYLSFSLLLDCVFLFGGHLFLKTLGSSGFVM